MLDHRALMEDALHELQRLQQVVDEYERQPERQTHSPIAIVGGACRFPGGADDLSAYWRLLSNGVDAISEVPPERWAIDRYYSSDPDAPGTMYTRSGGFVRDVDRFDAGFFGISPRECKSMDPQQRILLEVAWEALEHAGLARDRRAGAFGGIFVGITTDDYSRLLLGDGDAGRIDAYFSSGNTLNAAAGRLAYVLGFRGPAMAIDTACSSSLVALHLACQSLRAGECEIALAAGVNLTLAPEGTIATSRAHMLSPDGRCKTFDAAADGYVRGEGCGVVVLKRLADANADGDTVLAVIRGSAVNQDGASAGLTVPNGAAQEMLLRAALAHAGVQPDSVQYVEAHGTGTALGDPIELRAIAAVYGDGRSHDHPLLVGSVKTNLGHLESAAGIAGLLKAALMLQNGQVPPHLHLRQPTPHFDWKRSPLAVHTGAPIPWPPHAGPRRAAVSSFGFSGTNAHVVIEEASSPPTRDGWTADTHVYPLSARSASALRALAEAHAVALDAGSAVGQEPALADACRSAATGRAHLRHRLAAAGGTRDEIRAQLLAHARGEAEGAAPSGEVDESPAIAFLFTGQGAQRPGMARELYETLPVFRRAIDECADLSSGLLARPLRDLLFTVADDGDLHRTEYAQPALFAVEYALARVWERWGITPSVVLGHSVGEIAAAAVAGVFDVADGMRIVVERGRLTQAVEAPGGMATVFAGADRLSDLLALFSGEVVIAALNGPDLSTISGPKDALAAACARINGAGIATRLLHVSHAFHSPLMKPAVAPLRAALERVRWASPRVPLVSNASGRVAGDDIATPDYWCRQLLAPVDFLGGIRSIAAMGCAVHLEIGPAPILNTIGRGCRPGSDAVWLPSLNPGRSDWAQMQESLARLYVLGAPVDWPGVWDGARARRVELPHYQWQRRSFWVPAMSPKTAVVAQEQSNNVPASPLGISISIPGSADVRFEAQYDARHPRFLGDHRLDRTIVVPAASHVAIAITAARAALGADAIVLDDFVFPRALVLREHDAARVHLLLKPNDDASMLVEVHASPAGGADRAWTLHAQGRVSALDAGASHARGAMETIRAKRAARPADRTSASFYEQLRRRGYTLGPTFSWLDEVWSSDGEAVGSLRAPPLGDERDRYAIHPGLLDSCFQLLSQTMPYATDNADALLVPFRIARIVWHRAAPEGPLWAHALRDVPDGSGAMRGAVRLFASDGAPVVEVEGFEVRAWRRTALASASVQRPTRAGRYELVWRSQTHSSPGVRQSARWLLLGARDRCASLGAKLREAGSDVIVASPDARLAVRDDAPWTFDPSSADHLDALLSAARADGVVHMLSLDSLPADELTTIRAAQRLGTESALHLVQAVLRADAGIKPRIVLATRGVQIVDQTDTAPHVEHASMWAFAHAVIAERPEVRLACIDLPVSGDATIIADVVARELSFDDGESRVALRPDAAGGNRFVARLVSSVSASAGPPLVRSDGTYLITGGLGGLGGQVARWLASRGAGRIALVSRRGAADPMSESLLADVKAAGSDASVHALDVGDAEQVALFLAELRDVQPLRGIVHAAGVLDDALLPAQTADHLARVFRAKVDGAWNLHALTAALPLDFFVLFSSVAGLLGSPGQANYAAANGFLDALAAHRRARGLTGLSVAWGPWNADVGGMTSGRTALQTRLTAQGIVPLDPTDALAELDVLLASRQSYAAVLAADWSRVSASAPRLLPLLTELLPVVRPETAVSGGALARQLRTVAPAARRGMLDAAVRERVAQCLGVEVDAVAPRVGFFELGMDSLVALEFRNRLQLDLGVSLPATVAFQYPTPDALVSWLLAPDRSATSGRRLPRLRRVLPVPTSAREWPPSRGSPPTSSRGSSTMNSSDFSQHEQRPRFPE